MTKFEEITKILLEQYNIEVNNLGVFPGFNPDATSEAMANEIVKALDEIVRGDSYPIELDEYYNIDNNVYIEDSIKLTVE